MKVDELLRHVPTCSHRGSVKMPVCPENHVSDVWDKECVSLSLIRKWVEKGIK